jgi:hypothetical protein
MKTKTLGTALAVVLLVAGGAYAQNAPQPQDQMRAPGAGTAKTPGQPNTGPMANPKKSGPPQAPVVQDQQRAPGAGTAQAPGQKKQTTGTGVHPGPATKPPAGTDTDERGSAPGGGTATAPKH